MKRVVAIVLLVLVSCAQRRAEQLPIRTYTTADGLARDSIHKIVSDPLGYLWFCTSDGLSRFDGYEFANYSVAQGRCFQLTSSRATKENFLMVDGAEVLSRLRGIQVSTWNYISEGRNVRHMGPMADDFFKAFQLLRRPITTATVIPTSDFFIDGYWYIKSNPLGFESVFQFGGPGDIPVPRDYDGDGKADIAVFRPWTSDWFIQRTSDNTMQHEVFGGTGDIPVPSK